MNKAELVVSISEKANLSKKDAEAAVNALMGTVTEAVSNRDKVVLVGFGTFEAKERAARVGRNPKTGEEVRIAETVVPSFKPGKDFKESVGK